MNTLIKVARYHLADRFSYTALPWVILAFDFALALAFADGTTPTRPGSVFAIYVFFFAAGMLSMIRALPFALALGVSRRSYFAGTTLLAASLAVADGLALAMLQIIERATGGWGLQLYFFRVPYIFAGPWYLTWLTSFVLLTLMYAYGMWFGLVYRRWNLPGLLVFSVVQAAVLASGALTAIHSQTWPAIGRFFTTLSATGLTGLLAALAVALLAGGYATMHRLTV